jgi:hypothetical protein
MGSLIPRMKETVDGVVPKQIFGDALAVTCLPVPGATDPWLRSRDRDTTGRLHVLDLE